MSASFVPSSPKSIFTPSYSVSIDAPPAAVFALLTSRSTWKEWNGFVPHAQVLKPSPNPSAPRSGPRDDSLQVGQVLKFEVRTRILGREVVVPGGSTEEITLLSTPDDIGSSERGIYRACWDVWGMPHWLLKTRRVNDVVIEGDGHGTEGERCTYRTYMIFEGLMAYFVKWLTGWMVKDGLKVWAEGLKKAAEARESGGPVVETK